MGFRQRHFGYNNQERWGFRAIPHASSLFECVLVIYTEALQARPT